MKVKEKDIVHENGKYWVLRNESESCYFVMEAGATHSKSESAYPLDPDGLSIAICRCDYLARRQAGGI
jgi:hypothetical protein